MLERARDPQPRDFIRLAAADRGAAETYVAGSEPQCATDQVEHRGLSRAVRTDQAENLAGADFERQIVHGDKPAKLFARRVDLESRALARRLVTHGQRRRVRYRRGGTPRRQVARATPRPPARA